ncbi:MAG: hypothetical protein QNJ31_02460 [Candidatus Caenarcaniphilales bacterium]|nr:hypothetical protein [Candidatus Caenarcaniphilales bacterium]
MTLKIFYKGKPLLVDKKSIASYQKNKQKKPSGNTKITQETGKSLIPNRRKIDPYSWIEQLYPTKNNAESILYQRPCEFILKSSVGIVIRVLDSTQDYSRDELLIDFPTANLNERLELLDLEKNKIYPYLRRYSQRDALVSVNDRDYLLRKQLLLEKLNRLYSDYISSARDLIESGFSREGVLPDEVFHFRIPINDNVEIDCLDGWVRSGDNIFLGTFFHKGLYDKNMPFLPIHLSDALFRRQIGPIDKMRKDEARVREVLIHGIPDRKLIQVYSPSGIRLTFIVPTTIAKTVATNLEIGLSQMLKREEPTKDNVYLEVKKAFSEASPDIAEQIRIAETMQITPISPASQIGIVHNGKAIPLTNQIDLNPGSGVIVTPVANRELTLSEKINSAVPFYPTRKDHGIYNLRKPQEYIPRFGITQNFGNTDKQLREDIKIQQIPTTSSILDVINSGEISALYAIDTNNNESSRSKNARNNELLERNILLISVENQDGEIKERKIKLTPSEFQQVNLQTNNKIPIVQSTKVQKILEAETNLFPIGLIQETQDGPRVLISTKKVSKEETHEEKYTLNLNEVLQLMSVRKNTVTFPLTSNQELFQNISNESLIFPVIWKDERGFLMQRAQTQNTKLISDKKKPFSNKLDTLRISPEDIAVLERYFSEIESLNQWDVPQSVNDEYIKLMLDNPLFKEASVENPTFNQALVLYINYPILREHLINEFPLLNNLSTATNNSTLLSQTSLPQASKSKIKQIDNPAVYKDYPVLPYVLAKENGNYIISYVNPMTGKTQSEELSPKDFDQVELLPNREMSFLGKDQLTEEEVKYLFPKGIGKTKPIQTVLNNCGFVIELRKSLQKKPEIVKQVMKFIPGTDGDVQVTFPLFPNFPIRVNKSEYTQNGFLQFRVPSIANSDFGNKILEIATNKLYELMGYEKKLDEENDVFEYPIEGSIREKTNTSAPLYSSSVNKNNFVHVLTGFKTVKIFNQTKDSDASISEKRQKLQNKILSSIAVVQGYLIHGGNPFSLRRKVENLEEKIHQANKNEVSQKEFASIQSFSEDSNPEELIQDLRHEECISIFNRSQLHSLFEHLAKNNDSFLITFGVSQYKKGNFLNLLSGSTFFNTLTGLHAYSAEPHYENEKIIVTIENSQSTHQRKMKLEDFLNKVDYISITTLEDEVNWKLGIDSAQNNPYI